MISGNTMGLLNLRFLRAYGMLCCVGMSHVRVWVISVALTSFGLCTIQYVVTYVVNKLKVVPVFSAPMCFVQTALCTLVYIQEDRSSVIIAGHKIAHVSLSVQRNSWIFEVLILCGSFTAFSWYIWFLWVTWVEINLATFRIVQYNVWCLDLVLHRRVHYCRSTVA